MISIRDSIEVVYEFFYQLPSIKIKDIIEIMIIAFVIYELMVWARGTRAWTLFKGIIFLGMVSGFAVFFELNTILWIFSKTINVGIIALIVVFQPELRRALEQLGRRNFLNSIVVFDDHRDKEKVLDEKMISEIVKSVYEMSEVKTGALIVLEQSERLDEYEKTGIKIGAYISKQLLVNIFEHNTPLHDGAIIIRGNRIEAATCYLPLSDNKSLSKELGTRHRAGLGISEVTDAIVIIVSEENGKVSVALGGNLVRGVESEYLKNKLLHIFIRSTEKKSFKIWKGWPKVVRKDNE